MPFIFVAIRGSVALREATPFKATALPGKIVKEVKGQRGKRTGSPAGGHLETAPKVQAKGKDGRLAHPRTFVKAYQRALGFESRTT